MCMSYCISSKVCRYEQCLHPVLKFPALFWQVLQADNLGRDLAGGIDLPDCCICIPPLVSAFPQWSSTSCEKVLPLWASLPQETCEHG